MREHALAALKQLPTLSAAAYFRYLYTEIIMRTIIIEFEATFEVTGQQR